MKKTFISVVALLLSAICLWSLASCGEATTTNVKTDEPVSTESNPQSSGSILDEDSIKPEGLWKTATYLKDTEIGEGAVSVSFEIVIDNQSIVLTLKTDEKTLGDAMFKEKLINDAKFFQVLNGIEANWDKDHAYWAFYQVVNNKDQYMQVGVGDKKIATGETYKFVYTKG